MEHDEFIGQVQHRARPGSRGEAERATRAMLETLAQRIADGAAKNRPAAAFHARVVLEVAEEATTGSLMTKARKQFPSEFDRLFEAGSTGRMPASD